MSVNTIKGDLLRILPTYSLITDCLAGSSQVKAKGDFYLPRPNPTDTSEENNERYEQYRKRAVFYNATNRTYTALIGVTYQKKPVIKLHGSLDIFYTDIDGGRVDIIQQSKSVLANVLALGRAGIWVDYSAAKPSNRQQVNQRQVRPFIYTFSPENIINWRSENGTLTLIVIRENHISYEQFTEKTSTQYRVLSLQKGVYTVTIYRENKGKTTQIQQSQPTKYDGSYFNEIPFTFVGAVNNDCHVDPAPLYDIAELNLAHYRNSADYEDSCFLVGQPTPWVAGISEEWAKDVLGGKIEIGSKGLIPLPEGGNAGLLQASPNTMPKEAMEIKEKQLASLGAKIVSGPAKVERTATEIGFEAEGEKSVLINCAENVNQAYAIALNWAAMFSGDKGVQVFQINTDILPHRLDAQALAQLVLNWQQGAIDYEELRWNFKRAGVAYKDDDEARSNVEAEIPLADDATEKNNQDTF